MRGFAGIRCGPPATSTRRREPATAGIRTRATSANGTHPVDRVDRAGRQRVDGHLAPAGSSCELTELGTGRAAGVRCSRHSE